MFQKNEENSVQNGSSVPNGKNVNADTFTYLELQNKAINNALSVSVIRTKLLLSEYYSSNSKHSLYLPFFYPSQNVRFLKYIQN